nr:MAG TPA: hypothetical protein [Caudoviricetes sp.]
MNIQIRFWISDLFIITRCFLTIKITFRFVLIEVKIAQNVLRKDYISFWGLYHKQIWGITKSKRPNSQRK